MQEQIKFYYALAEQTEAQLNAFLNNQQIEKPLTAHSDVLMKVLPFAKQAAACYVLIILSQKQLGYFDMKAYLGFRELHLHYNYLVSDDFSVEKAQLTRYIKAVLDRLTLFLLDETLSQTESGFISYQEIAEKYPTWSPHFEINSERFCAIFTPLLTRFSLLFAPTNRNSTPLPSQANTAPALEDSDTQSPVQMPNQP